MKEQDRQLVAYVALDREFSEPILKQFEAQTGIQVLAKYDVESTKTVGLTTAIIQERNRPRCDIFWNNEILHTLRLKKRDLLSPFPRPGMEDWPASYKSPDGFWYGFAARARVLIVNTKLVPLDDRPYSIADLADPKWKGKVGIAKPLFGTTATHAAVLFEAWGNKRAREFFSQVLENCRVLSGNKQVATDVADGSLMFGLTDTDDAIVELDKGNPIEIVFPDQGDGMGTLLIPNSLALIKGSRHSENAKRLFDFLLSQDVETQLAQGPSAQIPLNPRVREQQIREKARLKLPDDLRCFPANFESAADGWESAAQTLKTLLEE